MYYRVKNHNISGCFAIHYLETLGLLEQDTRHEGLLRESVSVF